MEQNRINQRNSTTVVYFLVRLAGSSPKRGEHLGEFDIDMNQTKPPDKSGKHNLRKS